MRPARLGWKTAWPAAAALGVISSLNFDPVGIPFAMVAGVAGFIWLMRGLADASKRTVAVTGLCYGAGFMGPLIWWMNAVSSGAYIGLALAETLFFIPIALALRAACRLRAWPLWGAAVWVLGEWARGRFPFTGFPWGRLAHTSIDTPFSSYARLLGMPGTSAVLFIVAALVVVVVTRPGLRTRLGASAGILALLGIGAVLPTGIAGADGTRQVALVQGNVPGVFLTWPRGEILDLHVAETMRLVERIDAGDVPQPDMVLWPENATDIDPYADAAVRGEIETLSALLDAPILVGGLLNGPTSKTAYNSGVVWTADGPGDRYNKLKPVPFGEYVPFRKEAGAVVSRLGRDIPRDMLSGDEPGAMRIANTLIGDTICYDIAYDDVTRRAVDAGAQLMVVQTSNAAFTGTSQPEQQWDISRLRAIETGRWVVVPSTNGISGVVDPTGRSVERAPMHEPATLSAKVTLASGRTPAIVIGRYLEWLLVAAGLGAWWLGTRRRQEHSTP
ncbi:apolipoprotein N-acyltransferase [Aeromicrobium wangtongii]|uniref:apolipoprotein N-acyltransferase n=1 Tax=Aeromicrobium wangtongii TaxID=2969247 RepID=UPI002017638C|nr:apolipoprotein N-acyltransferase [Aeromicrobium wangtongii]MCL3819223.1 apolipoprotein N-acyltransferase [Aeromicrobium wangtongii]